MWQGDDYDDVAEGIDAEQALLNQQKPWECKVVVKGKVCGWRLKKYLVKHADSAHSGVGNFFSHITNEEKKFLSGTALAASKDAAAAAGKPPKPQGEMALLFSKVRQRRTGTQAARGQRELN